MQSAYYFYFLLGAKDVQSTAAWSEKKKLIMYGCAALDNIFCWHTLSSYDMYLRESMGCLLSQGTGSWSQLKILTTFSTAFPEMMIMIINMNEPESRQALH